MSGHDQNKSKYHSPLWGLALNFAQCHWTDFLQKAWQRVLLKRALIFDCSRNSCTALMFCNYTIPINCRTAYVGLHLFPLSFNAFCTPSTHSTYIITTGSGCFVAKSALNPRTAAWFALAILWPRRCGLSSAKFATLQLAVSWTNEGARTSSRWRDWEAYNYCVALATTITIRIIIMIAQLISAVFPDLLCVSMPRMSFVDPQLSLHLQEILGLIPVCMF